MKTGTNHEGGLKTTIVIGMVTITSLQRDMKEVIDGKTTTVQQKDTMKGMITRKGEKTIIKGGTITLEMVIQEKEGVKNENEGVRNKGRFLGTAPKSTTEEKEVLKEKETELPHASNG